jgi:murein DD-endopeptidase MepM/ murein hydrolase activator NlpD
MGRLGVKPRTARPGNSSPNPTAHLAGAGEESAMPAPGKHRRAKSSPLTRGFVAAGTGGAVIALPLMGAATAQAAEQSAPARSVTAAVAPAHQPATATPAAKAAPATYRVVAGDYLSKIAEDQNVRGGWQKLYADNREAVGANPSLIHPGLLLTIGAKAADRGDDRPSGEESNPAAPERKAPAAAPAPKPVQKPAPQRAAAPAPKPATAPAKPAAAPAAAPQSSGWTSPVAAGVSTSYRVSGAMWSSGYHTGVDFSAPSGTTVRSVGPGTVVSAGWAGAYGNEVVIKHTDGRYSQYAHLSTLTVSAGQAVTGGQQIGTVGSTGNSTGPHLHLEIRTAPGYGSDIDPLAYLRGHGVSI